MVRSRSFQRCGCCPVQQHLVRLTSPQSQESIGAKCSLCAIAGEIQSGGLDCKQGKGGLVRLCVWASGNLMKYLSRLGQCRYMPKSPMEKLYSEDTPLVCQRHRIVVCRRRVSESRMKGGSVPVRDEAGKFVGVRPQTAAERRQV